VAAREERNDLVGLVDGPFAEDDGFCLKGGHEGTVQTSPKFGAQSERRMAGAGWRGTGRAQGPQCILE
jgi:hypothetical protein